MATRFQVKTGLYGNLSQHEIINSASDESATIVDGCGASLQSLMLMAPWGELVDVVMGHHGDIRSRPAYGGAAILFPFANRVRRGRYRFMGQDYQLSTPTPSAHALHGFAMGKSWQILDKPETDENASIRCEFTIAENDFQGYPFNVRVESVFTLNIGEGPLPLTMGVHPYLTVAKSPADRIDFWELQFQAKSMLVLDDGIPTGEMRDISGTVLDFTRMRSIDGSVFDQGFADLTYFGEKARSIIRNPETGLEVELWQDSGFGYVQVYTLPPRASISIEPTSGAADAFNNGIGLTVLGPGEERSASYGIRIIH